MSVWVLRAALLLSLVAGPSGVWAEQIALTVEEQQWIDAHPQLRVGVAEAYAPFEYMEGSQLHGRSFYYLESVSRQTGLTFSYVPTSTQSQREHLLQEGQVDLLSSYFHFRNAPLESTLKVQPYHTTLPVIVIRMDSPEVYDLEQLQDKTVVIPDNELYEAMFRDRGINATLIRNNSAMQMLTLVKEGRADAVVADNTYLMAFLHREFQGSLHISGVVGGLQLDTNMAVRSDQTILFSILKKSLNAITPQEHSVIYQNFFRELDFVDLSLLSISNHYMHLLLLGLLALLALGVLVYRSLLHQRRAMRNEHEKNLFLGLMGHAIRTPMNAALAAMELLGHTRLNQQQRHFSDLANNGATALLRLLDTVFDTSQAHTSQLRFAPATTDVEVLVRSVVSLHRLRAGEKQLTLNLHIEEQMPLLLLDGALLGQVFHNLLSNAIKFTDAGYVDIDLRLVTEEDVAPQLQVIVRDTGLGISQTVQASLFRPYVQASHSSKHSGGTGLGLVICQQMMRVMNGTLTLTSEPGVGTTVTVQLPVTWMPEPVLALTDTRGGASNAVPSGLQVLVIEDTFANQQVLRAQITSLGCLPVIAPDAAQASILFAQNCYDLILMDCDLPDQDGYSLTLQLRALEQQLGRSRCPIIAISALTGDQHHARCMAAGMDGIAGKPIGLNTLREVIEAWCEVVLVVPCEQDLISPCDETQIYREIARDLGNLVKALALRDRQLAWSSAHRVHGAASVMEWGILAESSETLENLLRAQVSWDDPAYAYTVKALLAHWKVMSCGTSLEVLKVSELNG